VLFTPTAFALPNGSFSYILQNSDGSVDAATVNITGINVQQVNATAPGQILIGNDYALYFSISGDVQSFGGLSNADDEEIFKWNGSVFSEYYGGGELSGSGEDIDALQIIPSGGILFSITGDDEEFNGVASNAADNEDIFGLFGPSDTSYGEVTYAPGDGGDTWSSNNLNSLFQFSNGNLVMSFSVATDPLPAGGVTYQTYELVLYNVSTNSFSEFADGMLSSGVIDAVDVLANGNVIFSMAADTTLGGTLYEDSDLIRWNGSSYSKYFDGSDNGLSTADENIDGVSILGSDILVGGAGNDILMGLGGEDLLTGGGGADTFRLTDALAADTITDYNLAQGDTVDLSALLDQALIQGGSQGNLSDFVKLTNQGPDRVLQIDANGTAGGSSFTTVAIFSPAAPATVHILYDNAQADVPQT
jgi:Ca2+-binding RTX toxin-like protein